MILNTLRMPRIKMLLAGAGLATIGYLLAASVVYAQQDVAGFLLFPDPVQISPGGSAIVDIRLRATVPITEVQLALTLDKQEVHFVDLFVGTVSPFRLVNQSLSGNNLQVTLRAEGGFLGTASLAKILLSAPTTAPVGEVSQLTFTEGTRLSLGDGAPVEMTVRSTQIYIVDSPALQIRSTTHVDELSWYSRRDANASWDVREGSAYSYRISRLSTEVPDTEPEEDVGAIEMHELADGIWYFALCELVEGSCEGVSRRRYMIDSTSPREFSVGLVGGEDGLREISFFPHDELSGVRSIDIALDSKAVLSGDRTAWIPVTSPHTLSKGIKGDVLIRATDRAGNVTIARLEASVQGFFAPFLALGAFIIGVLVHAHVRRRHAKQ